MAHDAQLCHTMFQPANYAAYINNHVHYVEHARNCVAYDYHVD